MNRYTSNGLLVLLAQTAEIRSSIGNYAYHGDVIHLDISTLVSIQAQNSAIE